MALTIPTIWSPMYEYQLVRNSVFAPLIQDRSAELAAGGDRLKVATYNSTINLFDAPTSAATAITQGLDTTDTTTADLLVDQSKMYHFVIGDRETVQSILPLMENESWRHGVAHGLLMDDYFHFQAVKDLPAGQKLPDIKAGATYQHWGGNDSTFQASLANCFLTAGVKASRAYWPDDGNRVAVVAPEVAQELSQWMISQGVPDQPLNVPAMLEGDVGQRFRGWNLVTSVAIPNKDSTQGGGGRSDFIGSGANHAVTDDDRYKIVFMYRGLGVARSSKHTQHLSLIHI